MANPSAPTRIERVCATCGTWADAQEICRECGGTRFERRCFLEVATADPRGEFEGLDIGMGRPNRRETWAQPRALRIGDVIATGEEIVEEPGEGGNGSVVLALGLPRKNGDGMHVAHIKVPARIPIRLRPPQVQFSVGADADAHADRLLALGPVELREKIKNGYETIAAYQEATGTDYPGSLRAHQREPDIIKASRAFFSAYLQDRSEQLDRAREVIAFYADSSNWPNSESGQASRSPLLVDGGARARAFLAEKQR